MPGIKVDTGAYLLAGSKNEKITEGLDGLRDRLSEYYKSLAHDLQNGEVFTQYQMVNQVNCVLLQMLKL